MIFFENSFLLYLFNCNFLLVDIHEEIYFNIGTLMYQSLAIPIQEKHILGKDV